MPRFRDRGSQTAGLRSRPSVAFGPRGGSGRADPDAATPSRSVLDRASGVGHQMSPFDRRCPWAEVEHRPAVVELWVLCAPQGLNRHARGDGPDVGNVKAGARSGGVGAAEGRLLTARAFHGTRNYLIVLVHKE